MFLRIPGSPRVRSRIWWLAFGGSIALAVVLVVLMARIGR